MEKLQLTRQQIIALAKNQDDPKLRHEKAFLMHLFGSALIVDVFEILIGWLPYAKRPDGSIYKSDVELAEETGFSTKTIERARKILKESGFDIYIRKANGTPTNHYRLDLEKFIQFVSQKLKVEIEKVREWLQSPIRSKTTKARQTDVADSEQQSTSTPTTNRTETRPTVEATFVRESKSLTTSTTVFSNSLENNLEPTPAPEVTSLDNSEGGSGYEIELKTEINHFQSILKIPYTEIATWITESGFHRINNLTKYATESGEVKYPSHWVRWALKNKIPLKSNWKEVNSRLDWETDPYAAFFRN